MKVSIISAVALSALAASACVPMSVGGLRKKEPTLVSASTRSVSEITGCISPIWEKIGGEPSFVPNQKGGTLTFGGYPSPLMTMNIADDGSSRKVTLYGPYTIISDNNRHRIEEVQSCL